MTFIGPKPTDVPRFVTPFAAHGDEVRDANGTVVAVPALPALDDDVEMAQAIADAINEKYESKQVAAPEAARLRTLIGWFHGFSGVEFVEDARAYEVAPGLFRWAASREEAEQDDPIGWGFPNDVYKFVDVETGEEVK